MRKPPTATLVEVKPGPFLDGEFDSPPSPPRTQSKWPALELGAGHSLFNWARFCSVKEPGLLTLWTIQRKKEWKRALKKGVLESTRVPKIWWRPRAYEWMMEQMEPRIVIRPHEWSYPIWAWYQYYGVRRKRPDLRSLGHLYGGTKGVRVEFQIEPEKVLLSDFLLWHWVLNDSYLGASAKEEAQFEKNLNTLGMSQYSHKPLPIRSFRNRMEDSWQRVFDLKLRRWGLTGRQDKKSFQATLWQVPVDSVVQVTEFVARS